MSAGLIAAAEAHYRAGDHAAAAALLAPAAAQAAPAADVLRLLGLCRLRLGAADEALQLLSRAYAAAPQDPWVRLHYGLGLQACGRAAEAAPLFQSCIAALPEDPAPTLNLATALLALGDIPQAIRNARRAALRAPASAAAQYTLGLAYLAAGRCAEAAKRFRKATQLAPQFADAWLNLGVAQYRNGAVGEAKQAFRAALRADPRNTAAAGNLGGLMRLTGETEAAEALLRDTLARHPDAVAPKLNLAADLLQEGRTGEAMALLSGAVPAAAEFRQPWLLQRALGQIELGQLEQARETLERIGPVPPALAPLLQWRRVLLALAAGGAQAAQGEVEAFEHLLARAEAMLPEHRIMAHYDAAKFWSNAGAPARAMAHWRSGHELLARFQPFSRAGYAAFVEATIAAFDAERLRGPRAANRDPAPVFVVGMPRSGTTLTEQILAAHGAVHGAGERGALQIMAETLGGGPGEAVDTVRRIAALDAAALERAGASYLAALHALAPDATRIVDKMPGNFRFLGLAGVMLPGAKIISCTRDPRDIGQSIFSFRFYGMHPYAHDLSDLGWYIAQQRRLMAHWQAVMPGRILTVRLRDWTDEFDATLRRVLAFLDLPYDPACARFHTQERRVRTVSRAQVRRPINRQGLGRWKAYERELAPLIAALTAAGVPIEDDETAHM